jgi:hypothetical protein
VCGRGRDGIGVTSRGSVSDERIIQNEIEKEEEERKKQKSNIKR